MNEQSPKAASAASLTIVRRLPAPPERVFAAFTDPDLVRHWWGPEGCTSPDPQIDLRVGGHYRLDIQGSDGSLHRLSGRYLEISPPTRLAFTWTWTEGSYAGIETTVEVDLVAHGRETELTLTHSGFTSPEMCAAHRSGWESSLTCLQRDAIERTAP